MRTGWIKTWNVISKSEKAAANTIARDRETEGWQAWGISSKAEQTKGKGVDPVTAR